MRHLWLFLSLEHLEAVVGLLTDLVSILCLREEGHPRTARETGNRQVGGTVGTHTFVDLVCQNNYNSDSKDHWSQTTTPKSNWNVWNIARSNKLRHRDTEWARAVVKWCWQTCSLQSCHNLQLGKNAIWVNFNKTRYASTMFSAPVRGRAETKALPSGNLHSHGEVRQYDFMHAHTYTAFDDGCWVLWELNKSRKQFEF